MYDENVKYVNEIKLAKIAVTTKLMSQFEPIMLSRCSVSAPDKNRMSATLVSPNRIISIRPEAVVNRIQAPKFSLSRDLASKRNPNKLKAEKLTFVNSDKIFLFCRTFFITLAKLYIDCLE